MKAAFSSLVEIHAECDDCGWVAETANAQGLASQHAARLGHLVGVTITRYHEYRSGARGRMTGDEARAAFTRPEQ